MKAVHRTYPSGHPAGWQCLHSTNKPSEKGGGGGGGGGRREEREIRESREVGWRGEVSVQKREGVLFSSNRWCNGYW